MKHTYLKSMKINMGKPKGLRVPFTKQNNKMNVKSEKGMTRSNLTGHRGSSKRKHKMSQPLDDIIHSEYLFYLSN